MGAAFEPALNFVLDHEDAQRTGTVTYDAGGCTKWGIASVYHPGVDVENLTLDEAGEIYCADYWNRFHLAGLNSQRVASKIMDTLVNPGMGFAKTVQRIAGVPQDGAIGPQTIAALNGMGEMETLQALCYFQGEYYREHDANSPVLTGLLVRARDLPPEAA